MKRFRIVTILILTAIAIMVAADITYMHGLYSTIKSQSIATATECLRRADILEILSRINATSAGEDDSFIRLNLMIQGEKTTDGRYEYPNLLDNIDQTMSDYFHLIGTITPEISGRNIDRLTQLFEKELNGAGLHPQFIAVSENTDINNGSDDLWTVTINNPEGRPVLCGHISPLTGYVFSRMAGIVMTSSAILVLMSFLVWYLLHWVGKLRSIEQMKDDFTHNMTHELKTPVAVAYSAADSLLRYYDHSDERRNKKLLSIIMQRLSFLSGMIENILSMSMERFKTMRLNIERIHLKPLAEEVAGMIEMKSDKPVKIDIDIEDDCIIAADALHFGNVISNILDNAVKYSGESVSIKITGNKNKIAIADNGIGIPKESLPHIFDKFYRVTDGDRYNMAGYGLGLYYVKQITDMHGWSISVASDYGAGTMFTIRFDLNEKR